MIGDLLFYRMHQPSLGDELILLFEGKHTDFVHVAIQVSETRKVEATYNNGIVLNNVNNTRIDATYTPKLPKGKKLDNGLTWLQEQVGQDYGYGDIADVILRHPVFECHYDCSALAATYLLLLKDKNYKLDTTPHMVTPQMLADALGIQ